MGLHVLFVVFGNVSSLADKLTTKVGIFTVYGLFWTFLSVSFHVLSLWLILAALIGTSNGEIRAVFQVVLANVLILPTLIAMLALHFSERASCPKMLC